MPIIMSYYRSLRSRVFFVGISCAALACTASVDLDAPFTSGGISTLAGEDSGDADDADDGVGSALGELREPAPPPIKFDALPPDSPVEDKPFGVSGCRQINVLFVVDISWSMGEEKDNLNANFPEFIAVLDDYIADPGNPAIGYRIGLTNSAIFSNERGESPLALDGELFNGKRGGKPWKDCGMLGKRWIDGPAPWVTAMFTCAAPLPKSQCKNCVDPGYERPLDALEAFVAKSAPGGVNEGFYTGDEALLVVVLLTDEDDDVENTTTTWPQTKLALDEFARGEDRYVLVTIAGPPDRICKSEFGSAAPAPILHEFTNAVPYGVLGDICSGDLADSLAQALEVIVEACDSLPPAS